MLDVLVVGAGPAGLAAAVTVAESGRSVMVVDENRAPGGQIWRRSDEGHRHPEADDLLARAEAAGVRFLAGATVFDAPQPGELRVLHEGQPVVLRARNLVLATGARERFIPFPGWTLPGVVGVGGLQALVKQGFSVRDRRIVIAGSGPLLLAVAAHVAAQGGRVVGVYEQAGPARLVGFGARLIADPAKVVQALRLRLACAETPYCPGSWVVQAEGKGRVERAVVAHGTRLESVACDLLAVGYGLVPNGEAARLLGCAVADDGSVVTDARCRTDRPGVYAVGECAGIGGVEAAIAEGVVAGLAIAESPEIPLAQARAARARRFSERLERAFALRPELRGLPKDDTLVCRCEDVRWGDLRRRTNWREAKLATRCGMGPCQGRICGAALRFLAGFGPEDTKPPLVPVPGACLDPFDTEPPQGQE